jgi:AcrR family transcriptional regulator
MSKGERTLRKILEKVAPIFNKHGYEGSSLTDVMAATGLRKGGIYRHFASKEELSAEAFDYTWEEEWNARLLLSVQTMVIPSCDYTGQRHFDRGWVGCRRSCCRHGRGVKRDRELARRRWRRS